MVEKSKLIDVLMSARRELNNPLAYCMDVRLMPMATCVNWLNKEMTKIDNTGMACIVLSSLCKKMFMKKECIVMVSILDNIDYHLIHS